MKIAYFGMPLGALLLERDGRRIRRRRDVAGEDEIELVYVAIARDDAPGVRRARRVFGARAFVRPELNSPAAVARIAALKPELIVSWFWTKRLPREILALAPAVGVHPSLLPRHRGPDPFFWAIDAGDEVTGVTAHRLDETYDTGAILRQVPLRIDPAWNAWTLAKKLDRPSLALLREIVAEYARGAPPEPIAQNDAEATEAPAPTDDMLEVRWNRPADAIARRVRAAAPWPGAFTEIGGETVVLLEVRPTKEFPRALAPGEGAVRRDGIAVVRAADGALELRAGRQEEDNVQLDATGIARLLSQSS